MCAHHSISVVVDWLPQQAITEVCLLLARVRYRDDLEKHGVAGSRAGESYFRFLKNIDVTNKEMCQQVLSLVDIFKKQNIRVVCDPKPEEDTPVAKFLSDLADVPQLHFA